MNRPVVARVGCLAFVARVACLAFVAIVTVFGGAVARAEPGDERVDRLVAHGWVRTFPWMRSAPRASFRNVGPLVGLKDDAPNLRRDPWELPNRADRKSADLARLRELADGFCGGLVPT